ncbi:MAG: ATP-binding protein [bacterium]
MEKPYILLVDDKEENLLAYEPILAPLEIHIVKATSGKEALHWLLKEKFALILRDVAIPKMDGLEAIRLIEEKLTSERIPTIFIIPSDKSFEDILGSYSLGAVDCITKPIIPEILRTKVSVFIDLFKAKKEIEEKVEMLSAINQELEAFVYSASHDLRSPLATIEGFCDMLLKYKSDKLDPQIKHYIERMDNGVKRMDELLTDLLTLSRITKLDMERKEVNLSETAKAIRDELKEKEPEREVEFLIQDDVMGRGDSSLLKILLENLIFNAYKFTSKREKARIEFGVKEGAYFVSDNGIGFDMAEVDKLFAPFSRLVGISEFPGTGIGLSIVKRIVHRHQGKIWAIGEPDKGATFFWTIM